MFPTQKKVELFARKNFEGWDNWGLEIPEQKVKILSKEEIDTIKTVNIEPQQLNLQF